MKSVCPPLVAIFYHPQTKFEKLMFLHLCASHSVHGRMWQGACMTGGVHGRGMCVVGGLCGRGGHVWWGVCVARGGGVHDRGHAWWGACVAEVHACQWACMPGDMHDREACVAGGMCGRGVCMVGGHAWHANPPWH